MNLYQQNLDTCKDLRNYDCSSLTNPEDKFNCLERYGKARTPEYCVERWQATDRSQYPLKNKYDCL